MGSQVVVMFIDTFMDDVTYVKDTEVCMWIIICYVLGCICYGSENFGVRSYGGDTEPSSFAVVHNFLVSLANSSFLKRGPLYQVLVIIFQCSFLRRIVRSGIEVPTFATRRLHACHHARAPSGGR